jgi:hypothetical protein
LPYGEGNITCTLPSGRIRAILEQIVRQCIDKGLVKGKRQIIDSTPVFANISLSSLSGLVRKCRENVLKTVAKQDTRMAEDLGAKELQKATPVKFTSGEEALQKEIEAADWSLTPGRYVGVAPPEEDENFDFEQTIRDVHTELADLNKEAAILAAKIQENFEELGI